MDKTLIIFTVSIHFKHKKTGESITGFNFFDKACRPKDIVLTVNRLLEQS